jgi:uncharacterized protein (DUF302 family)
LLEESVSQTASDLVTTKSSHPFPVTLERLETAAKKAGLVVFAHLDHAGAAKAAGLEMPPATVLVVGNPKAGTPQFLQHPTLAIDLPLKMLVWENQAGEVFVSYNAATFARAMLTRHGFDLSPALMEGTGMLEQKQADITRAAVT